jgi:hypothetical protein
MGRPACCAPGWVELPAVRTSDGIRVRSRRCFVAISGTRSSGGASGRPVLSMPAPRSGVRRQGRRRHSRAPARRLLPGQKVTATNGFPMHDRADEAPAVRQRPTPLRGNAQSGTTLDPWRAINANLAQNGGRGDTRGPPCTAAALCDLIMLLWASRRSRVRWWYQRARAWWQRRHQFQRRCAVACRVRLSRSYRRLTSATDSGMRPGSAGGRSSGLVGADGRVEVAGRIRAAVTAWAARAAMARARCRVSAV